MPNDAQPVLFSVVIPTRNREHTIMRALRSLQRQSSQNWEAIVVDDHSSAADRTEQLIAALDDERIFFYRQTASGGAAAARNYGVQRSRGNYIAFLDSDDYFLPEKLHVMQRSIEEHPSADECVFYSSYRAERKHAATIRPTRGIDPNEPVGDYLFVEDGLMQTSGLVLSRRLALDVPFDESLKKHQDYDLVLRLEQAGAQFHFLPSVLTVWSLETDGPSLGSSGSPAYSVQWLNNNLNNLSKRAQRGFLTHHVLKQFNPWQGRGQYLKNLRQSGCWRALSVTQKTIALSLLLPKRLRRSLS